MQAFNDGDILTRERVKRESALIIRGSRQKNIENLVTYFFIQKFVYFIMCKKFK